MKLNILFVWMFWSIEQNVGQANTESHSVELDQILASYKVNVFVL